MTKDYKFANTVIFNPSIDLNQKLFFSSIASKVVVPFAVELGVDFSK